MVGAQAGVHRNIPDGQQVLGSPAIPIREQRRIFQMIARLPEMHRQLRELSAQVAMLTNALRRSCRRRDRYEALPALTRPNWRGPTDEPSAE